MLRVRSIPLLGISVALLGPAGALADPLTPAEVVRTTLDKSPRVQLALAQVDERAGQLKSSSGIFDGVVFFNSQVDFIRQALVGEVLKDEKKRRIQLELVDRFFTQAANSINAMLEGGDIDESSLLFIETGQRNLNGCSPTQTTVKIDLGPDLEGNDQGTVFLCLNAAENFGTVQAIGIDLANQGTISTDGLRTLYLFARLAGLVGPLEQFRAETIALLNDQGRIALRIVRQVAEAARFARRRLGDLPQEQEQIDFQTQLGYRHRFRNGLGLTPTLELRATEDNFAGKPFIVQLGDSTRANLFTATARLALDVPLGKNRGRAAVEAPEVAARLNFEATRSLAVQTGFDQALEALLAYWRVVADSERVLALQGSVELARKIDEAVGELIRAQEMPRVERDRSQARVAEAESQLAAARQQLAVSRLELGRVMGVGPEAVRDLEVDGLDEAAAWLQSDPPEVETLLAAARSRRADLAATEKFVSANRALERASRINLRPEVTLALNVSYSGLEESFEERFYDVEGFWKAASGKVAGPSYGFALRFSVPFGNHQARGKLVQAESNAMRAEIERSDLARTIEIRVRETAAAWSRAKDELEGRRRQVEQQGQVVEQSLERMKAGDLSVLDLLQTETQLLQAKLGWIEAARAVLEQAVRARYEAGMLLEGGAEGDPRTLRLAGEAVVASR